MSPNTIIKSNPDFQKGPGGFPFLEISEFFTNTIQGEGIHLGHPATFLRMQHCTLDCVWCDTKSVWRYGNPYSFEELFQLMEKYKVITCLENGQHLILTGGSPLKQQIPLTLFIEAFINKYNFKPYIEIENECTLIPREIFIQYVDCWNNSPKLENSGNSIGSRYHIEILEKLSSLKNSWFKFVITCYEDWAEIYDYVLNGLIKKEQIILMPEGETKEAIEKNREMVINIAIQQNVRYCTREHVIVWDKKTGV